MADVQQTYRFKFEFDRKDIKKQLNNISLDVKDAIAKMGDASDKVVIFKDLMTYLSNVDKALDMFKSKHKDDFANLFGNPDADLTKLLESIFDTTRQAASGFATLKDKIDAAAASNAKLETLKGIANEINELFVSVGKLPPIDIDKMFTGRGSKSAGTDFKGRIDLLNGALAEFGATYSGVQDKFKNGFNFGGTGGGSGSGMGDGGLSDFNEKIKKELNELEQQITELEQQKKKIQNIIRTLNGETINIKVNKKNDAEMLVDLINEYERLSAQLNDRVFRESASSNEYKKVKAERFDVASRLVHVASFVENEGSNMAGDIWTREHKVIDEAKAAMAEFRQHSQAEMQAIIKIFKGSEKSINSSIEGLSIEKYFKQFQQTTGIRDTITSVEQLVAVLNEYNRLSADPVDTDGLDTNSKKEALYDLLTNTNKLEENLGTVDDLLWNLNADNLDETANKLKEILGLKEKLASGTGKGGSDSGTGSGDGDGTGTGSGEGKGNDPTEVDFSHLENTITTETGRIVNKLGETLKVEIVKDSTGDSPEVEGVKSALTDMFNTMSQQSTREYKALLSGQNVYTKAGDSETISYKTSAEAYLSRLNKDIDLDVHSHQGLAASINTVDLESAIKRYYGGITKLSATIGGQDITTLDLTRVKAEDAYKALAKLEELVSKSKYKSVSAEQLNDIFSEINPKYLNVAQSWDPSQFGDLAQKIISIKQNSEQAITPLERLKNIITVMSDGKVDLSKYEKLFKDFSVDKAAGIFNDIMQQEGITKDGQILQVDNTSVRYLGDVAEDIREQKIEFANLRQTAKLAYSDIRNEAEKYLSTGDTSFFEKFFHPQDLNALYGAFADVEDQLMTIDQLSDKIAGDFGIKTNVSGVDNQTRTNVEINTEQLEGALSGLSEKIEANTGSVGRLTEAVDGLTGMIQKENEAPSPNTAEGAKKTEDAACKLESYNKLVNYITDLIHLKSAANNKDRRLLPQYDENGILQSGSGYYGARDIKNNRATKASIRRQLDLYATDVEFGTEAGAKRTLEDLISCIATYQDLDEARSVFKQKELGIWDDIVSRINAAKEAQEAYEKYEFRSDIAMRNAASIGNLQDKSFTWGDFGQFENLVSAGNLDDVLAYLKQRFQIDLLDAVETNITQPSQKTARSDADNTITNNQVLSQEAHDLEQLRIKLGDVQAAITKKTDAFIDEGTTVGRIVGNEIVELNHLYSMLEKIQEIVSQLNVAEIKVDAGNLDSVANSGDEDASTSSTNALNTGNAPSPTDGYALDKTVFETNRILGDILKALGDGSSFSSLVEPLKAATDALQNASNGIIEEHKRKKVDTRDADARLADPATVEEIKKAALNAVGGKVVEGGMMDVTDMTAMADGAVRVSGYVQTAADKWEGFTLQVNKANEASKTAYSVNAKAAKEAQRMAEEAAQAAKEVEKVADNAGAAPKTMDQVAEQYTKKSKERELQKITGQVNLEKGSLGFNFNARNLTDEQDAIVKAYDRLIAEMDKYEINVKNGQQDTLYGIEREKKSLFDLIDAYKIKNNIVNAGRTGNKKAYGATIVKNATSKYNALSNAASTEELKNSDVAQQALAKYTAAYQELVRLQSQYKVGQVLSADEEQEFNDARIACNNYAKELDKLLKVYQKSQEGAHHYEFGGDFEDTVSGRQKALKEFLEETYGASATFEKFDKDFNTMIYTVDNGDGTFTRMTASINNTRTAIDATAGEAKEATGVFASFWNELKGKFKSIGSYLIASFSFQEVIQVVRQGITYVREIDSALTELKKVTDETDASYDQFLQDMSKTGSVIGATVADLTTMAAEWARLNI